MPDQLNYSGPVNILDVDDFAAVTTLIGMVFRGRVSGVDKILTGQNLANTVLTGAQLGSLPELTSGDLVTSTDKLYIYDASTSLWKYILASALTSSAAFDSLTSGTVTAEVARTGGSATTISTPASGEYTLTVQSGAHLMKATIYGNNTTLNGSSEMLLRINNNANSRERRVTVQIYDASTGALVDQHATGTNHTQTVASNVTLLTIPGLNGFGAAGFYIEIT